MQTKGKRTAIISIVLVGVCASASATNLWSEPVNGDFSGDYLNPSVLNLQVGDNTITGFTEFGDLDYFRLQLQPGMTITNIWLTAYQSDDLNAFMGFQAGPAFTVDADSAGAGDLLGWTLFGPNQLNQDLLSLMSTAPGAQGFTPPLSGPQYTFWVQQIGDPTNYTVNIRTVPEPATMSALALGLLAIARRRRVAR